ncbi:ricin-type beta-trefoil lectin domain protein [Streptomyces sp. NPDC048637]|uniref:RICIN domain-containing protein n=1 Tax=Streptomyces sp. NPDC048637 TaxID=3155636 RepID=UPI00342D4586
MNTSHRNRRGTVSLVAALLIALLAQGFLATGAHAYPNAKRPPNVGPGTAQAWARTLANGHASRHLRDPGAHGTTAGEFPRLIQETLTSPDDGVYLRAVPRSDSRGVSAYYTRQVQNAAGNQVRLLVIISVNGEGRMVVTPQSSTAYFLEGTFESRVRSTLGRDYSRPEVVPAGERGNAPITGFERIVVGCGGTLPGPQKRSADQEPGCKAEQFDQEDIDMNGNIVAQAGCLKPEGGSLDNGTGVTLNACVGGDKSQSWNFGQGTIATLKDNVQKCLAIQDGNTSNGTPVTLNGCSNASAQHWVHRDDGTLYNPASSKCLDIPNWNEKLILWDCKTDDEIDNSTQKFDIPTQAYKNPRIDECLEAADGKTDNGTPVRAGACNGSNAQRWSAIGSGAGAVKVEVLEKCLDIQGESRDNGTPVTLYECARGTTPWNQLWTHEHYGTMRVLKNPETGKCLDAGDKKATLQPCNGNSRQNWGRY